MSHNQYPSDLTDQEWQLIEPFLPRPASTGRPRENDLRDVWDALFYIARTGCQWRYLPHDFPSYITVHRYFRQWRDDGTFERINDALAQEVRKSRWTRTTAFGRNHRLAQREDDRGRRPFGLRRGQKDQGAQASHPR